jgi:hypothetical protein
MGCTDGRQAKAASAVVQGEDGADGAQGDWQLSDGEESMGYNPSPNTQTHCLT